MGGKLEVRGISFQMLKDVFPHLAELVGPDLGEHFDEVDVDRWYEAAPYIATVRFLTERISPQGTVLIGYRFVVLFRGRFESRGIKAVKGLIAHVPDLYRISVRGEGAGG